LSVRTEPVAPDESIAYVYWLVVEYRPDTTLPVTSVSCT